MNPHTTWSPTSYFLLPLVGLVVCVAISLLASFTYPTRLGRFRLRLTIAIALWILLVPLIGLTLYLENT